MFKKISLILILFFCFFVLNFWNTINKQNFIIYSVIQIPIVSANNDITSENFSINTSLFSPWWNDIKKSTVRETAQNALLTIIEKLILAIWVVALFIMTIWAWYMIIYHWEDSLLTKWKNMFNSWLIALVLALSAELIVKFVAYLLY